MIWKKPIQGVQLQSPTPGTLGSTQWSVHLHVDTRRDAGRKEPCIPGMWRLGDTWVTLVSHQHRA